MSNLIFSPSSSLLDPAIRIRSIWHLPDNNTLRLIAGCGNDWSISTCEFLLEVHVLMSNLIFSPYSCLLDPAIETLYVENYPITTHSALLLGVAMTDPISTCEFLLEVHVLMSNLIFSLSSSLMDPAIRLCCQQSLFSFTCRKISLQPSNTVWNVTRELQTLRLIAGSSKLLEREKMRFDISTCTSRRNSHVEIDQSLPHPAIRRSVLLSGKCTTYKFLLLGPANC